MKKTKASTLRALVAAVAALVIAIGYFSAVGIGNLSSFGIDVFSFLCPLGYLESLLASKVFVPRALISFIAVVVLVIILGRVFCAWVCPMPFLQKIFPGLKKKETVHQGNETPTKRSNKFAFDPRFGVLLGALGSAAIFGFPVFCLICPVGLTFATIYVVMRLFVFGEATWTVILLPAILLVEVVFFRKWCSKICPLGALMSLIAGANKTLRPSIDNDKCLNTSQGIACFACAKNCPEHINIRKPEQSETSLNNCTKCRECSDHCPAAAISFPLFTKKVKQLEEKQVK